MRPNSRSWRAPGAVCATCSAQSETSDMLKIKVLNVSKKELLRDLQRAPEFDQSALFKKVYEEEFGVFGGAPFGALIGDYEFGKTRPGHRAAREDLAGGGRGARAVHHSGVARDVQPGELHGARRAARPRQGLRHHRIREVEGVPRRAKTRATSASPAAHPAAPAVRHRTPFRWKRSTTTRTWTAPTTSQYLWGNAAWALGARLTNAFAPTAGARASAAWRAAAWWKACRCTTSGPTTGDVAMKCPTEMPITDRREKELADLGFIPLVHCKNTDYAAFFSVQSAQKPKIYDERCRDRERADLGAAAVHPRRLPLRALPEGDDARQDRRLHVARAKRSRSSTRWIRELRGGQRRCAVVREGEAPPQGSRVDVHGSARASRVLPRRRVPEAALPAG